MAQVTVFGFTRNANGYTLAVSMALILFFLTFANYTLTNLDKAASKTAFRGAIQSLYKELVVMGITSFILTLLTSAGFELDSWLVYLVDIYDTFFMRILLN